MYVYLELPSQQVAVTETPTAQSQTCHHWKKKTCGNAQHSEDELWLTTSMTGPKKEENETWTLRRTAQTLNSILPKHMGLGWRKG